MDGCWGILMGNEPCPFSKDNPLVRALARWENEGGSVGAYRAERVETSQEEECILIYLGLAVIRCWNNLPVEIQRELFMNAASCSDPLNTAEIKEQIARFLHSHKD